MNRLQNRPFGWLRPLASWSRRLRHEEDGVALVIVGAAMIVMLGMCALTIDVGRYFEMRRQLQNAADAAVHAGAQELPDVGLAEAEARDYFDRNAPSLGSSNILFSYPGVDNERMQIHVTAQIPFIIGPIFGLHSADAQVTAMAGAQTSDIVVVIDRSGSMCWDSIPSHPQVCPNQPNLQPITATKQAALLFASNFSPGYAKLGLVSYATTATLNAQLTTSFVGGTSTYANAVNAIHPADWTNIGHSISIARTELGSNRARNDSVKVIVLMSDGIATAYNSGTTCPSASGCAQATNYAITQAQAAAASGYVIYTIGLGASADHALLQQIATIGGGQYVYAPSADEIGATFQQIANLVKVRILQ